MLAAAEATATLQLGWIHHQSGNLDVATTCYRRVLDADPTHPDALNLLAGIALLRGEAGKAISLAEAAISSAGAVPNYWNTLGMARRTLGDRDAARAAYLRAIHLEPGFAQAHNNIGNLYLRSGEPEKAMVYLANARRLSPNYDDASFNEAFARLLMGDLLGGWPLYESRLAMLKASDRAVATSMACPQWRGESLHGRSIILLKEQGFGDQIQFLRFVSVLSNMGARVDVLIDVTLAKLASSVRGINRVLTVASELPSRDYHYWSFLGSIPLQLKLEAAAIPNATPYMGVEQGQAEKWRRRIDEFAANRFRLGLVWSGSSTFQYNDDRSLSIHDFEEISSIAGLCIVSLQKGPQTEDLLNWNGAASILDVGQELRDFSDTAGALNCIDMLLTVDTSVAHLAGALGRPTWTLLSRAPDWRWLRDHDRTVWYPTMRLFRQNVLGDWGFALEEVQRALGQVLHDWRQGT